MRESSLDVDGARLFYCLPKSIRNISGGSIEKFKSNLDRLLKLVLDEPLISGYTIIYMISYLMRRADSNSLLDLQVIIKTFHLKWKIQWSTKCGLLNIGVWVDSTTKQSIKAVIIIIMIIIVCRHNHVFIHFLQIDDNKDIAPTLVYTTVILGLKYLVSYLNHV